MKPPAGMWTMLVTTPRPASSFRIWMRKSPRDPGISNCVGATPSAASFIGSAMPASRVIGGPTRRADGRLLEPRFPEQPELLLRRTVGIAEEQHPAVGRERQRLPGGHDEHVALLQPVLLLTHPRRAMPLDHHKDGAVGALARPCLETAWQVPDMR